MFEDFSRTTQMSHVSQSGKMKFAKRLSRLVDSSYGSKEHSYFTRTKLVCTAAICLIYNLRSDTCVRFYANWPTNHIREWEWDRFYPNYLTSKAFVRRFVLRPANSFDALFLIFRLTGRENHNPTVSTAEVFHHFR